MLRPIHPVGALALSFIIALPLLAQRDEPINNEHVRVLVVTDKSKGKGPAHEHAMNRVMIYLDKGAQRLEYQDGRVVNLKFNAGDALWSAGGGMHTSENIGGTPYRIVEIELKNKGGKLQLPPLDPVKIAPANYKVVLDNPQVRVVRAHIQPHGTVPMHEHTPNRVVVFLTDARLRVLPKEGAPTELIAKAGDVRWSGASAHGEENLSDQKFEVLSVEVK
jgi:quercetin dioxygenase-like cupin family protein